MDREQAKKRIEELRSQTEYYAKKYYASISFCKKK